MKNYCNFFGFELRRFELKMSGLIYFFEGEKIRGDKEMGGKNMKQNVKKQKLSHIWKVVNYLKRKGNTGKFKIRRKKINILIFSLFSH